MLRAIVYPLHKTIFAELVPDCVVCSREYKKAADPQAAGGCVLCLLATRLVYSKPEYPTFKGGQGADKKCQHSLNTSVPAMHGPGQGAVVLSLPDIIYHCAIPTKKINRETNNLAPEGKAADRQATAKK